MRNIFWFGGAGIILVGIAVWALFGRGLGGGISNPLDAVASLAMEPVKVSMANSSTKKKWLEEAAKSFNAASRSDGRLQVGGRPIEVEFIKEEIEPGQFDHYRSGTMVKDTVDERIRPDIASPSEDSWLEDLNRDWKAQKGRGEIISERPVGLVRIPLVIAMWQSRAEALGCWPQSRPECTWDRVRELAVHPAGWGMVNHPEWKKFKFGYGYVGESNSGTLTALLLCMTGLDKTSGLTIGDVTTDNACGQSIRQVEEAKVHSGKKSGWLLNWMKTGGPEYLDAVTTNEPEVITFNQDNAGKLREPLVAAYPQDGTVVAAHPFGILDKAPWSTPEKVAAAKVFRDYLLSAEQQRKALEYGLRPADPSTSLGAPFHPSNGVNPDATLNAVAVPDAATNEHLQDIWHKVKKHSAIVIVFDKSGSMSGDRITQAVKGAEAFVNAMDADDWLMWMPFDSVTYPMDQGLKSAIGERLLSRIRSTSADGGTALYEAVYQAHQLLEARRKDSGVRVRYGIVILSDGADTSSKRTLGELEALLKPTEWDPTGVQIHAIGIGEANKDALSKIATTAHGKYWEADQADVARVYREIAAHY